MIRFVLYGINILCGMCLLSGLNMLLAFFNEYLLLYVID